MLVLTRKVGEAVVIPRSMIRVTVTRIEGNRVKLGFEAPHGFDVYREELIVDNLPRFASTKKEEEGYKDE